MKTSLGTTQPRLHFPPVAHCLWPVRLEVRTLPYESSVDKAPSSANEHDKAKNDAAAAKNPPSKGSAQPDSQAAKPQPNPSDENIEIQRKLADYNARLANYTKYLVWIGGAVGFAQVLLMLFQGIFTCKSANAARDAAKASQDAVREAQNTRVGGETNTANVLAEMNSQSVALQRFAKAAEDRLHVEGVRTVDFYVEMEPVFFVKIVNSGPEDALKVIVSIQKKQARTYCYKYQPKGDQRPNGVPQFIDCDLNPDKSILHLNSIIAIKGEVREI